MVRIRRGRALFVLCLLLGVAGLAVHVAIAWWDEPLAGVHAPIIVEVPSGARVSGVAAQLGQRGVLNYPTLWAWQVRIRGLASRLRAGEYELRAGASPHDLATLLVSGRVLLHPVTLVEGWTVSDVVSALHAQAFLTRQITALDGPSVQAAIAASGLGLEGQLFPDTYLVPKGTTDLDVLQLAHARMENVLAAAWSKRALGLPFTQPYQALTLASIIEKETGNPEERARIAGVFVNRLRKGMRLQTDPTVIYGLKERYTGVLHKSDLLADTPWNTYTRDGLPPTPIALPGRASLEAALHPAPTQDLYFVASVKGDGRHTFSASLSAHNAAVAAYVTSQRQKGGKR
jgi:UPF0755 protein